MNTFKIAAVQLKFGKKPETILKSITKFIEQAKAKDIKILCFPEDTFYLGPKKNKKMIAQVQKLCQEQRMWVILAAHLPERGKIYNTAVLINDKGKISGIHKKVHIYDDPHIRAGSKFEVYKTPFCKIGIAICWDISCPESIRAMVKKGAMIIFCPMSWGYEDWAHHKGEKKKESEKKILKSLILTRAFENQVYFIFCNQYDPKTKDSIPYSVIAEPHKILKEIYGREGLIAVNIDLDHILDVRKKYIKECGWPLLKKSAPLA
jgi:omega-amidase